MLSTFLYYIAMYVHRQEPPPDLPLGQRKLNPKARGSCIQCGGIFVLVDPSLPHPDLHIRPEKTQFVEGDGISIVGYSSRIRQIPTYHIKSAITPSVDFFLADNEKLLKLT